MREPIFGGVVVPALAALMLLAATPAGAQTPVTPAPAPVKSNGQSMFWVVGGMGFAAARAGCPPPEEGLSSPCDADSTKGSAVMADVGLRVTPRLDVGVEFLFTNSNIDGSEPIRTTFILGIAQVRPWQQHGFFFRAGMGAGFVGSGLDSSIGPPLNPPYTTNTLAMVYGAGWVFQRGRRVAVQAYATHHVAALGEVTFEDMTTIKNVIGNYWTTGIAFVFR